MALPRKIPWIFALPSKNLRPWLSPGLFLEKKLMVQVFNLYRSRLGLPAAFSSAQIVLIITRA